MTMPYSYVVLRYQADVGAAESLNIGVVVFSSQAQFLELAIESSYGRLSKAFAAFDGTTYRRSVAALSAAFKQAGQELAGRRLLADETNFKTWLDALMPDVGGSISPGPMRHGLSSDLNFELAHLFERMVTSQQPHTMDDAHRDDAAVWRSFERALPQPLRRLMRPKTFETTTVKAEFEHAVKNGAWHVIQPVTMDFRQAGSLQRKASEWAGTAVGLHGVPDLGSLIFLVGQPRREHVEAYHRAKALLQRAPGDVTVIEEAEADRLAPLLEKILTHEQ